MATADAASVADGLGAWGLGSARGQHIGVLHVRRDIEVMSGLAVFGVRALLCQSYYLMRADRNHAQGR